MESRSTELSLKGGWSTLASSPASVSSIRSCIVYFSVDHPSKPSSLAMVRCASLRPIGRSTSVGARVALIRRWASASPLWQRRSNFFARFL
jgi:hypothetical protein